MKKTLILGEGIIKRFLALYLILYVIPLPVMAGDSNWAEKELAFVKRIDGIHIDKPDSPADIALQEKIFKLAALGIAPQQGLIRYSLLKYMADELKLPEAEAAEVPLVLGDYIDVCDY